MLPEHESPAMRPRKKVVLSQDRLEYVVNERIESAMRCLLCGGPTKIVPSVFLQDRDVLQCLSSCYLSQRRIPV